MVEEYDRRRRGNSSLLAAGSQTRRAARVRLSGGSSLTSLPPTWLTVVAWISIGTALIAGGVIGFDIFVRGHRQTHGVMNAVYPITALYLGPLALLLYWRWGRKDAGTHEMMAMGQVAHKGHRRPRWVTIAIEVFHCGSGCVLGDLIGEWTIYALALTVAGRALYAEYIGDYILAISFGIVFQYFAIAPMLGLGVREGLKRAAQADFIALTAFEIGLFGWMALMASVFFPAPHPLMVNSAAYWFLMQIGMIVGFVTSWPANVWLLNRGIKLAM